VRIARRVFQRLLDQSPTPERCMEAFHLQRTRFELVVERKLRRRQLTDDGNVEITGGRSARAPETLSGSTNDALWVNWFRRRLGMGRPSCDALESAERDV
jgi:hypothetical protein